MTPTPITPNVDASEAAFNAIEAAKTSKSDDFRVRVGRRKNPTDFSPVTFALFDGIQAAHINDLEFWLPLVVGGGSFQVKVFHRSAPGIALGTFNHTFEGPTLQHAAVEAFEMDNWKGPGRASLTGPVIAGGNTPTPVSTPSASAATSPLLWEAQQAAVVSKSAEAARAAALLGEAERRTSELERDKMKFEADKARFEAERRMAAQERQQTQHQATVNAGAPDMMTFFTKLMEMQQRADERAEKLAEKAEARTEKMLEVMRAEANREDPMKKLLMEKAIESMNGKGGSDASTKLAESTAAAMNTIMGATMQLMQTKMQMQSMESGDDETPVYKLAGRGIDVLEKILTKGDDRPLSGHEEDEEEGEEELDDNGNPIVDAEVVEEKIPPMAAFEAAVTAQKPAFVLTPIFFELVRTDEFKALWNSHKGNVEAIITEKFGRWAMDDFKPREAYLKRELTKVFQAAVAVGIFRDDGGGTTTEAKPAGKKPAKKVKNGAVVEAKAVVVEETPEAPRAE